MTDTHRSIDLERTGPNAFRATNERGATLDLGDGATADFTPVELLLVALGGCSALTVDEIISRRAEPHRFNVRTSGEKIRDEHGNRLVDLQVTLDIALPEGEAGDAARAVIDRSLRQTRERLCTVSRTVEVGTPVQLVAADLPKID